MENLTPPVVSLFLAACGALFWLSYNHPKSYNDFLYPIVSTIAVFWLIAEIILWGGYTHAYYQLYFLLDSSQRPEADKLKAVFAVGNNNRYNFCMVVIIVTTIIRRLEWIGVVKSPPG